MGQEEMDVKLAYLLARGFCRVALVRTPKKGDGAEALWKLLVPAYGLTDSSGL